ncbi:MAG: hypothetical protein J6W75_09035 [Bacteroidaceae bacterium]|nr:hypothetical protein [Bacteroidaceae bacterium]
MRQRLLSIVALAALALSAMAQTWTAPIEPTKPEMPSGLVYPQLEAEDIESGNTYYIRNVECGQFITGANSWATQISLSDNMTPYLKVVITEASATWDGGSAEGYTIALAEDHYFSGDHNRVDYRIAAGKQLFRDSEESGFVDLGSQNRGFIWSLTKTGDYYYIQTAEGDPQYPNAASQYAAAYEPGAPVKFNAAATDRGTLWQFIPVDNVDTEAFAAEVEVYNETYLPLKEQYDAEMEVYNAAMSAYEPRIALYNMLNDAVKYGADYSDASNVYNNPESTTEQIQEATEALRALVRVKILEYAQTNSTTDNLVDLTNYVLVNPDFNTGNINGWTVTEGIGQNQGYQANNIYRNEEQGITIEKFIEAWRPAPTPLSNGFIYQTIKGLPDGHYILECDGIARNQTGIDDEGYVYPEDYTGIYLYYSDGVITVPSEQSLSDIEVEDEEGTVSRVPAHFSFEFDIEGVDSINVGLMADNTNLNWMAADNFKLSAAGKSQTPPSYTALRAEVANSKALKENGYEAQRTVEEEFESALKEAEGLVNAGADPAKAESYTAAFTRLNNARTALVVSIEAYGKLEAFIEKLNAEEAKYNGIESYKILLNKITELLDKMETATGSYNLSAEEINAAIDGYDDMVTETIKEMFDAAVKAGQPLDVPLDITPLIEHMSFEYGTTQTAFTNGYPAENPVYINETQTGNFKTNYGTAEVWNVAPFNIYRDLADLPKGKYRISTHAFYRISENASNYNAYINEEIEDGVAVLYAGNNSTQITNVAAVAGDANINSDAEITDLEGNTIYVINNQQGAYKLFTEEQYEDRAAMCRISAEANVINDGDVLRFGIRATDGIQNGNNSWVLWYGFTIEYMGMDDSGLIDDLKALIAQAEELADPISSTSAVVEAVNKLNTGITNGNQALATQESTDIKAAITELTAAIAYAKEADALRVAVTEEASNRDQLIGELANEGMIYEGTEYPALIDEIFASETYESKEQLEDFQKRLEEGWIPYLLTKDFSEASLENPIDFSEAITNATFDNNNKNGWVVEATSIGGTDADGCIEFWQSSPFELYQELPYLKEGFWRLEVDAFYRAGSTDNELSVLNLQNKGQDTTLVNEAYLYAAAQGWEKMEKLVQWSDTLVGAILVPYEEKAEYAPINTIYTTTAGVNFDAPNSRSHFQSFIGEERYHNVVTFHYGQGEGAVRFGIRKLVAVSNDWCPIDNFRLSYLGTEAPVGVEGLAADKTNGIAPAAIFAIDGRQQGQLRRGINIMRMSDGTIRKVLVK